MMSKVSSDRLRLDVLKPMETKHEFAPSRSGMEGELDVRSLSYKNKIRRDQVGVQLSIQVQKVPDFCYGIQDTRIDFQTADGTKISLRGRTGDVAGKQANLTYFFPYTTHI